MNEVRNLPEKKVTFMGEVRRIFVAKHTGVGVERPEVTAAVKVDLTRHIASTLDGLQDEIKYALDKEFGRCEDWTSIKLYGQLARVVALLSGRVFVGRPLSRDEEWIDSTTKFTADCSASRVAIMKWRTWLRPFIAPFLPEIRTLNRHKARGAQLLAPMLKDILTQAQDEKVQKLDDSEDEQGTFINWVLRHTDSKERADPLVLATNQMMRMFLRAVELLPAAYNTYSVIRCNSYDNYGYMSRHI
jgi:hypothetical protein